MVLQYANFGCLRAYLQNSFDSLQWKDKLQMALDITCGLMCLHSENIIHRDLHSKNILVHNDRLMIADLGLSKSTNESTSSSMVCGMPAYVEPQCYKTKYYKRDKKSDIYSLGVLLWELSSGNTPFSDLAPHEVIIEIFSGNREIPVEDTPSDYIQIYQNCWHDVPNSRPDIEQVHTLLTQLKSQFESNKPDSLSIGSYNCLYIKDTSVLTDNMNQSQMGNKSDISSLSTTFSNFSLDLVESKIEDDGEDEKENYIGSTTIELQPAASDLNNHLNKNKISKHKRFIKARLDYPEDFSDEFVDVYYEVKIKSEFLLFSNAVRSDIDLWGTGVYCSGSDVFKALVHSHPIELTETPPPYDVIVTLKILGPQKKFVGSESNGISSLDYYDYNRAFTIEDYVIERENNEIDEEKIFVSNVELSKDQVINNNDKIVVVFKSGFLTIKKAIESQSVIWGTNVYSQDSDLLKALIHSKPIKLTANPPPYDIIATVKVLGKQLRFIGSFSNGVNSDDFDAWDRAFIVEDYQIVMNQIKDDEEIDLNKITKIKVDSPDEIDYTNIGHFYEVVFKSKELTFDYVYRSGGDDVWGTNIYCGDSDVLKALYHSKPVKLTEHPPPYDIVVIVKILGEQPCFIGTYSNGIESLDYSSYEYSFTILDYKIDKHD
ncbi:9918_t:CDS:2 [Funneliformis geosporum]|uniref:9918_t:CDS:1 n=1 Tax=Funneliformis geosporum TaxID=1117311 RepID=A0A9W4ST27_9GLOM|nr:9918_t:CDS:2 [Funneliformis geosporum]